MRQSQLFARTKKEAPREAVSVSHKLLARGDFIDQLAAGIYTLLPLGWRVFKKIEEIIREEMNAAGGQEFFMPTLIPKNLWQETGRWETIDPPLFVVKDRHGKELALGPTHEEVITDLVRRRINSYKDLPFFLYQIQNKFRNELRATGGLLRVREFIMKDLYSFHSDPEDLAKFYSKMAEVYLRIYRRCGLEAVMVEATSGSIGGNQCHEFMVFASSGEDKVAVCSNCNWAANQEAVGDSENCSKCGAKIKVRQGIEAGHIFKLDENYSQKMKAEFVAEDGRTKPIIMGCYGIGLGRLLAAAVEVNHDSRGIVWPESLAPFMVQLISLNQPEAAEKVFQALKEAGLEVLYDDRDELSPGEKFADADLIGLPWRLVVSAKTGIQVEVKKRTAEKAELMTLDRALEMIKKSVFRPVGKE